MAFGFSYTYIDILETNYYKDLKPKVDPFLC